jgi:sulfatase maturation enzyme AslB (radical SAM superfamily)
VVVAEQRYGAAGQVVSNGIQTNGLLLTPEWARFLNHYHFWWG